MYVLYIARFLLIFSLILNQVFLNNFFKVLYHLCKDELWKVSSKLPNNILMTPRRHAFYFLIYFCV